MAELISNILTLEIKDGLMHGQRVIKDKQSPADFIAIAEQTETDLIMMREFVANYEDAKKEQKRMMKLEFANKRNLKEFDKAWEQHEMGMLAQKKGWEKVEIPKIEAEIEILLKARDDCVLFLAK